jgi:hypothetical protein
MDLYIRADWTTHSQYHIDFARGTIVHSRAASRGQTNRLFKEHELGGTLKHLSYPQAATFFKKNRTAELYLQYLRALYPSHHLACSTKSSVSLSRQLLPSLKTTAECSREL